MNHLEFIRDLALVMSVTAVVTLLFHRLKQPAILGYIVSGVLIGPHLPQLHLPDILSVQEGSVQPLAQMGVLFLMFSLGLTFSFRRLAKVGIGAFVAATLSTVLMIGAGYEIGRLFGWTNIDSLFLGALLSTSSTSIIVKLLSDMGKLREPYAELAMGITIAQDVLSVAILALLPAMATAGRFEIGQAAVTLGWLSVFLAVTIVVGLLIVPRMVKHVDSVAADGEMLLLTALGLCFGLALLAGSLGYSMELGAFLMGALIAESPQRTKIDTMIGPLRDAFCAVFFVATGLMIDPMLLKTSLGPIAALTALAVLAKMGTIALGAMVAGNDAKTSLRVGAALVPLGEFSFIIAGLGQSLGVTGKELYPVTVTVATATTFITPYLMNRTDRLADSGNRWLPEVLVKTARLYRRWIVKRMDFSSQHDQVRRLLRKWFLQMMLNAALMTGIFGVAVFFGNQLEPWSHGLAKRLGGADTLAWLAALLLSLPLLVANWRKLRATGMLIAEVSVARSAAGLQTPTIRAVISHVILFTGMLLQGLWLLLLSTSILPPGRVLIALLAFVALLVSISWTWLIRLYAKAQITLKETLTPPPL